MGREKRGVKTKSINIKKQYLSKSKCMFSCPKVFGRDQGQSGIVKMLACLFLSQILLVRTVWNQIKSKMSSRNVFFYYLLSD